MKKIFILLLSCFLMLSFVGCTPKEPDNPAPNGNTDPSGNKDPEKTAKEKLIEQLSANYQYVTGKDPGCWFMQVDNFGNMIVAIYCAGGPQSGNIGEVKEIEANKYEVRLDVPAFEGNDYDDGYDAYSLVYVITLVDDNTIIVKFPEGYEMGDQLMNADNGLNLDQLTALLSSYGTYREDYNCFSFNTDRTYSRWIDCSEYFETGKISDFNYEGFDRYTFKVEFPERAASEELSGADAYTMQVSITIFNNNKSISIEETVGEEWTYFNTEAE